MSVSEKLRKHELECLRLASDCRQLACNVPGPALKSHFNRMAREFEALAAASPPSLQLIDSLIVRAHQYATGGKRKGAPITPSAGLVED